MSRYLFQMLYWFKKVSLSSISNIRTRPYILYFIKSIKLLVTKIFIVLFLKEDKYKITKKFLFSSHKFSSKIEKNIWSLISVLRNLYKVIRSWIVNYFSDFQNHFTVSWDLIMTHRHLLTNTRLKGKIILINDLKIIQWWWY